MESATQEDVQEDAQEVAQQVDERLREMDDVAILNMAGAIKKELRRRNRSRRNGYCDYCDRHWSCFACGETTRHQLAQLLEDDDVGEQVAQPSTSDAPEGAQQSSSEHKHDLASEAS